MMERILLASSSPRRREILTMAGIGFDVLCADTDESFLPGTAPQDVVMLLARRKAEAVSQFPEAAGRTIVAADTIVYLNGRILGKPHSKDEAFSMLSSLSGRTNEVFTGVCIWEAGHGGRVFYEKSSVEFYPLSQEEIREYIATGEPMDKAGAYGIQGRGSLLVRRIDGDYFNVMGLPVAKLFRELREKR